VSVHAHAHDHHGGDGHGHATPARGGLRAALIFTLAFALVEAAGGWWSGSLALLSDAGHMLSDASALAVAAFAARIARRPPSLRHSYGLARAEVIAASLNGLLMLAVIVAIVVEAIVRLQAPQSVAGGAVMAIALGGLAVNTVVAFLLSRAERTLNTRAALVHVMGDMFGSVAAILAGAVIYFTGWTPIDALLSILVAGLILFSTLHLLRDALHVLMEGVPPHVDIQEVGVEMASIEGVLSVHDLHIWTLASGKTALSAHVNMTDLNFWPRILKSAQAMLSKRYAIEHVTLQPEMADPLFHTVEAVIPVRRLQD
jgi:cobalt-zinc-cadmium efflux system protein